MTHDRSDYAAALSADGPRTERERCCRAVSSGLTTCGNVLWAFGVSIPPYRRALAIVAQMAGALSRGAVSLLESSNWYAAAALVRQLVETEYLLFLFADEPREAEMWLAARPDDLRRSFAPAAMRGRSAGRFRDREYWSHCEIGGHPHPRSAFLLPDHIAPRDGILSSTNGACLWVDLGQHLERGWGFFRAAVSRDGLSDIGLVASTMPLVAEALVSWHREDPCADRLPSWMLDGQARR